MAPLQRRRKTRSALKIAGLCAANAFLLACLWKLVTGTRESRAAPAEVAEGTRGGDGGPAVASAASMLATPVAASSAAARDRALEARVRRRIREALDRASEKTKGRYATSEVRVSVAAREVGAAGELVSIDAERAMRPASNLKLVTSAAALVLLGPDGAFETRFESELPPQADGRLAGDLVVRAGGDPIFDPAAPGHARAWFDRLAEGLAAAGVRSVEGALVLDEASFAEPGPGPAWPSASEHWKEYCALAGGFTVNAGCLTAIVRAGPVGGAAQVEIEPAGHGFGEKKHCETGAARAPLRVAVSIQKGVARVEGTIPKNVPEWSARFAVPDPVELFGRVCVAELAARGIRVRGGWKRERRPAGGALLARVATPISGTLVPINTDSNNAVADQLFFALGHQVAGDASRSGAGRATARALEQLGVPASGFVQVDGSGLSRENKVSARAICALLGAVLKLDPKASRLFVDSLAVGASSGTLDDRMRDPELAGRVHAKTGFISGTSALSGLIDARDGRAIVFSILVEYPPMEGLNTSCWKPMQDAICAELAGASG